METRSGRPFNPVLAILNGSVFVMDFIIRSLFVFLFIILYTTCNCCSFPVYFPVNFIAYSILIIGINIHRYINIPASFLLHLITKRRRPCVSIYPMIRPILQNKKGSMNQRTKACYSG